MTYTTNRQSTFVFLAVLLMLPLASACDSVTQVQPEQEATEVLSEEQQAFRAKLQQTALVLTDVVNKPEVITSLHKSVQIRRSAGYDEDVPFAQLLGNQPHTSAKAGTKATSAQIAEAGQPFAEAFRAALATSQASGKSGASAGTPREEFDLEQFLSDNNVGLYWPYADHFEDTEVAPTITFHPMDESVTENEGYRPIGTDEMQGKAASTEYETLMVDESYAKVSPTLIVVPVPPDDPTPIPVEPVDPTEPSGSVVRVSLGWVQCRTTKYDSFWSGGPDLRFRRIKAEGENGEVVLDKPPLIEVNPSRGDCEDHDWIEVGTVWDSNWEVSSIEQGFVINDWDRFGETTVDFNLGYEGDAGVEGLNLDVTVDGSLTINNGEPIFRNTINRDSYLAFNETDLDNLGMREGFGIRGAGTGIRFTLPSNIYDATSSVVENVATAEK